MLRDVRKMWRQRRVVQRHARARLDREAATGVVGGTLLHPDIVNYTWIVIAVVLVRIFRWLNSPEASDEPSASPTSAEATADERQRWLVILALIAAALLAIGLFVALTPRAAASQETRAAPAAVTQSAYLLTKGTDTIVVERVTQLAFGVDPREVDPQPRWYNEKEGTIAHFWMVDVLPDSVSLKAIDENGVMVDAFTLP